MSELRGTFRVLLLYNVSESTDLIRLRRLLGAEPANRAPALKHAAPDYVRFEQPPVIQKLEDIEGFSGHLKYFDYGVVSAELSADFEAGWDQLIGLSKRWIDTPDLEP